MGFMRFIMSVYPLKYEVVQLRCAFHLTNRLLSVKKCQKSETIALQSIYFLKLSNTFGSIALSKANNLGSKGYLYLRYIANLLKAVSLI